MSTGSFQAGRTTGVLGAHPVAGCAAATACNCCSISGTSLGVCSVSSSIQSKPAPATSSLT